MALDASIIARIILHGGEPTRELLEQLCHVISEGGNVPPYDMPVPPLADGSPDHEGLALVALQNCLVAALAAADHVTQCRKERAS